MFDPKTLLTLLLGVLIAVLLYLLYIAVTKGVPAAKAKLSAWWNAAKKDVGTVKADLAALESRVGVLEGRVLGHTATGTPAAVAAPAVAATATAAPAPPATAPAPSTPPAS